MQEATDVVREIEQEIIELHDGLSNNDLIPMEYQHELIDLRERHTRDYFRIGDIINTLTTKYKGKVTQARIERAVGSFVGKSERTARYYAETAIFFAPLTRDEFDMLPFSHFVLARTYGNDWHICLRIAQLNPGISVKALQKRMSEEYMCETSSNIPGVRSCADGEKSKNKVPPIDLDVLSDRETQKKGATESVKGYRCAMIIGRIANLVGEVQDLVTSTELPKQLQAELVRHSAGLQACVEELVVLDE